VRVRVWISGADGPSHDFELVEAPRLGDHISINIAGETEEGFVARVSWHLQAIERTDDLSLDSEPVGAVTMVHVICGPGRGAGPGSRGGRGDGIAEPATARPRGVARRVVDLQPSAALFLCIE
jgi:hypothetical protein